MYLCYCDKCTLPIKEGDKKFIFMINESEHPKLKEEKDYNSGMESPQELLNMILAQKEHIKTYEICATCKRVLDHFINLRASKVQKIAKILDKLDKKEETIILPEGENGNV